MPQGIRLLRALLPAFGLALGLAPGAAPAYERAFYVQSVSAEEDLAQNTVSAIFQDRAGFVWIATQGGLHRYDGYHFALYQHNPEDRHSLPSNFVSALAQDDAGRLWVGTDSAGLSRLDAEHARFVPLAHEGETEAKGARDAITALLHDPDSGLWIGSRFGIELAGADLARREVLRLDPAAGAQVFRFARAPDHAIWAATSQGLYRIAPQSQRVERVAPELPGPVLSLYVDRGGRVWVGTADGLHAVAANAETRRVWPAAEGYVPPGAPQVQAIEGDESGRLWLAVFPFGLTVFDPATGKSQQLASDPRLHGTLREDTIRVLMRDRSGLLWLGGIVHGVANLDPEGAKFLYLLDENASRPFVDTNNVRALYEDETGSLWLATEGDGLKRYDLKSGRFEYFGAVLGQALGLDEEPREFRVFALAGAGKGRLWVASSRGVFLLEPQARRATALPLASDGVSGLSDPVVRSMLVARDGTLWLGGMTSGVTRYDPARAEFRNYRAQADERSLWHNAVHALLQDRAGRIWIGTFDGLNVLEPGAELPRRVARSGADPQSLAGDVIRSIHEASDGTLWFGSHNGLSRLESLDASGAKFKRYLTSDGLPNATVYAIQGDAHGTLWLSGNRGIVSFDREHDRFQAFSLEDGLQGLEFNGGAALRLSDGRLAFGGTQGVNLFTPERITRSSYMPELAFTGYQVGNRVHAVPDPGAFQRLATEQRERIVGFQFAAFDFAAPQRNRFQYQLEGFDNRWLELGNRHELQFTNLDPGRYTLHVRGSNRDQVPSTHELVLALEVSPPWFATLPMKALYVLAALAALWLSFFLHRRRLLREQQHTRELSERESRLKVAIWGSGDEFWDWDIRAGVLYRVGADNLLGFDNEHEISGDDWRKRAVHPEDLERVEKVLAEHVAGKRDFFESEHRVRNARGEWIWVRSRGKIVERDEGGEPMRIAGTARDISEVLEVERERRTAREVIRSMSEAVTVTDLDFCFVSVNPAFTRITGYREDEVRAKSGALLNCSRHDDSFHQTLRHTAISTGHWSGEIWQRRKDGEEFLCWLELSEVRDAHGQRSHWVGVLSDITARKRAEQELRYLANFDPLTGLPNRTLLGERLAHALLRARRHGTRVALLFLDLDRFKHVNDSLGHAAGDRLLAAAADRIRAVVRGVDTVARLGGDEFTVVLEDLHDQGEAERVAEKLLNAFRQPLQIDGQAEVVISTSIGIALFPDHGQVPADLLKYADSAMYHAKDKGRNTQQSYTETMEAQARLRASTIAHLHKALERNEFQLVYQPKMALADGRITGVEALLRWKSAELGSVPPSVFIPLAEDTGLILPIGEWVLREACSQLARWSAQGLVGTAIAVNVSMAQLTRGELAARMASILGEHEIPAHRLELELTESMVMANPEQSIRTLSEIKSLGVRLAIDDFGTGYSSLAYLKRLPIDTIKIDKEFVGDITTDPDDEAITATVIMMAHSLDLEVVAEGVETPDQLEYLRQQKCDEVQGNLISAPMDAERCFRFLQERRALYEKRGLREFPAGPQRRA